MVFDHFENRRMYISNDMWQQAFDFLSGLTGDAEEMRYPLLGDAMYAVVESYATRPITVALPESHRRYVDIQMVLSGSEQVGWWSTGGLSVSKPYNPERDIVFYDRPHALAARMDLMPGLFAIFYPPDAHMPNLCIGATPDRVKKVVVKISMDLIQHTR